MIQQLVDRTDLQLIRIGLSRKELQQALLWVMEWIMLIDGGYNGEFKLNGLKFEMI